MAESTSQNSIRRKFLDAVPGIILFVLLIVLYLLTVSCGGTNSISVNTNQARGTASTSISDPPSCRVPAGNYKHVYISIRSVMAHLNPQAPDTAAGWQELAPQLNTQPVQIDLLGIPQGGCTLAMLGSNVSLPVGDYQQIRLILVSNSPGAGEAVPSSNACGSSGFNCVVLSDDSVHQLSLSSQANTGLKIPAGQIVGGPIRVSAGQNTDINIDFNACASILRQGNGQYRLKPTLTAGQVSRTNSGLSGQVVDATTQQPIVGGTVLVALEQADGTGLEQIIMQTAADANGNFNFCPLPTGTYDVVAVALNGAGVAYAATVAFGVPQGTSLGKIPLQATTGTTTGPGTIQGVVTATTGTVGSTIDVAVGALQSILLSGSTRLVNIPLLTGSSGLVATSATPSGVTCPANTHCAGYTLVLPAVNPSFGTFSSGSFTFSTPAAGDVLFTLDARAFLPASNGLPTCTPSRVTQDKDSLDQPLKLTPGASVTAKQIDFTACP